MVQEYYVAQLREAQRLRLARFENVRTRAGAEEWVRDVRRRIADSFGPMPPKTPLNPRVTATIDRADYRIENILFESRPGFLVTANLYLPKNLSGKAPGVVGTCGHTDNGKAGETYQSFAQGLARQGYVVLLYDPIGQGERLQYDGQVPAGTREHLMAGNQQFLVGEFFGAWRAWDGIRALDYLLTRPEVDPKHVGVTGNSGGGTLTTWLCGWEQRWTMAAPSCFVTTFRRNLENELPADTEQCPPRALALGLDHEDFIAAMAPKPVILLGKEKDYFDARGLEEAFFRLKRLWSLLGAEDQIDLFIGPTYHGYSQENREAMYGWFNRATGVREGSSEPTLTLEKDETLAALPAGVPSKPIYQFTREKARMQAAQRPRRTLDELRPVVRQALALPERRDPAYARILRNLPERGYPKPFTVHYVVETEPGIQALVYRLSDERLLSRPPQPGGPAIVYLAHHSADLELREEPLVKELLAAEPGAAFYAVDVRGIGESRPDTAGANTFFSSYGSDYFYAVHALMLDRPYVGGKTLDALTVLDWLSGYGHDRIHLAGNGWSSFPALFAAVLSDKANKLTLKGAAESYQSIVEMQTYEWPLSTFVPDVIRKFDLPELRAALGERLHMV
ncbi:MAG: acetylxylan esterase [Bryobacterales bacterium]|nr:acetylxylan esterase [Bryobacterales bacterium]